MSVDIRYTIDVHTGDHIGYSAANSTTYSKVVTSDVAPHVSEVLLIGEGEIEVAVKRRWFDDAGGLAIELVAFQVNPSEKMARHCQTPYRLAWYSADGIDSLDQALRDAGWIAS